MLEITYATHKDKAIWLNYDKHINERELLLKIAAKRCYILRKSTLPVGVMRYNLFWDSIPFLTLIYLNESNRGLAYGRKAMLHWEKEMHSLGFPCVMTSTRADETAQFFYRKLGYKDTGCLFLTLPALAQPAEIFFIKEL